MCFNPLIILRVEMVRADRGEEKQTEEAEEKKKSCGAHVEFLVNTEDERRKVLLTSELFTLHAK